MAYEAEGSRFEPWRVQSQAFCPESLALPATVPTFLPIHIINTRGLRNFTRIDIDFVYEIANRWLAWAKPYLHIALVLLWVAEAGMTMSTRSRLVPQWFRGFGGQAIPLAVVPMQESELLSCQAGSGPGPGRKRPSPRSESAGDPRGGR